MRRGVRLPPRDVFGEEGGEEGVQLRETLVHRGAEDLHRRWRPKGGEGYVMLHLLVGVSKQTGKTEDRELTLARVLESAAAASHVRFSCKRATYL